MVTTGAERCTGMMGCLTHRLRRPARSSTPLAISTGLFRRDRRGVFDYREVSRYLPVSSSTSIALTEAKLCTGTNDSSSLPWALALK